ncbi:hypothetical protein [uncultured Marinococcus sp.]|uniref:hypothetical protein n=1 Tax=uncultured Marinococcus sp. TaxID=487012 RepID=UPI00260F509C|nr:hypothetical protein [uncultured Marinococcus sp.]
MKRMEWVIVVAFIVIGLGCLTMSAIWAAPFMTVHTFIHQLALVCFWVFLPLGALLLLFYIVMRR